MLRLVYAPKAFIFIRSANMGGKIYDVSTDVTRGSVTQNVGDVSTAEFELRNRYQKWLRDPSTKQSIFLPMDLVTVWLQRISGRPIQVFTGYLDEVPYYQGYPGDAIFKASCTLKKLAFTWFDPGLITFTQWVQTNQGWYFDPSTGEGQNAAALGQGTEVDGSAALSATGANAAINDTGFANLLGRFMTDIAGWSPDTVLISDMPKDIPKIAAQLFNKITSDTQQDLVALESFFKTAMGIQGWTSPDATTPITNTGAPVQSAETQGVLKKVENVANQHNVPILTLIVASFILTGFDETYSVDANKSPNLWGYGLYALRPQVPTLGGTPNASPFSVALGTSATIDGKNKDDLQDATISTGVMCDLLNSAQGAWIAAARNNDPAGIKTWIEKAIGRKLPNVPDITNALAYAKKISVISTVVTPPTASPATSFDPSTISWTDSNVQTLLATTNQLQTYKTYYSKSQPWLASIFVSGQNSSNNKFKLAPPSSGSQIILTGPDSSLKAYFKQLFGENSIDSVTLVTAGQKTTQRLVNGVVSNLDTNIGVGAKSSALYIDWTKRPAEGASSIGRSTSAGTSQATSSISTDPSTQPGAASFQQLATFSADAAFAANFAFPTDVIESEFLTGDRALMNDVSCLDAVKQFCASSLRTFRSLPDGRFLAFYPDYFGAHRAPYWQVYNIELTDFGIQLNDDALATHVYVVGDTFDGDGQITDEDDISTRGVATITQAFMLQSFIEPYSPPDQSSGNITPPAIGRLASAYDFLNHYGARPYKEEQPLIRNTFYEFLYAWQKFTYLWSQQFATNITFTFQPEIMAGGLISFPDHDVQMFVDSVTHTFDYVGGFDTQATMTAPSLTKGKKVDHQQKPGFALGGNVNTVGVDGG